MKEALDYFAGWLPFPTGRGLALVACALGLVLLGFGIARLRALGLTTAMRVLIGFPVAFAIAYYLGRAPHAFPWYGVPVTWALLVLCAIGLGTLFERSGRFPARALAPVAVAAVLAIAGTRDCCIVTRRNSGERDCTQSGRVVADRNAAGTRLSRWAIGYQGRTHPGVDPPGCLLRVALMREGPTPARAFERIVQARAGLLVLRSFEVDRNRAATGPFFETAARIRLSSLVQRPPA